MPSNMGDADRPPGASGDEESKGIIPPGRPRPPRPIPDPGDDDEPPGPKDETNCIVVSNKLGLSDEQIGRLAAGEAPSIVLGDAYAAVRAQFTRLIGTQWDDDPAQQRPGGTPGNAGATASRAITRLRSALQQPDKGADAGG